MDSSHRLSEKIVGLHPTDAVQRHAQRPALNLDADDPFAILRVEAEQRQECPGLDRVVRVIPNYARGRVAGDGVEAPALHIEVAWRPEHEGIKVVDDVGARACKRIAAWR